MRWCRKVATAGVIIAVILLFSVPVCAGPSVHRLDLVVTLLSRFHSRTFLKPDREDTNNATASDDACSWRRDGGVRMVGSVAFRTARADPPGRISLLETLSEWKYPDSKMLDGASMSDGGNPTLQSIKCRAVLTTPDPIEKVIDFYSKKLATRSDAVLTGTKADALVPDGKSVSDPGRFQGRPVTVRVIAVNKAETSTTLVISRANDEKETHIAWLHYIRLGEKR